MYLVKLYLFLLLSSATRCSYSSPHLHPHLNNASDQHSLLQFKASIAYDPLNVLFNWNPNRTSFCNWSGVACSPTRDRVVVLDLTNLGLQEYGLGGRASTKGDVYSYGILLMEMLTTRRPSSDMFVGGLDLQKWVSMAFPDRLLDVVDGTLLSNVGAEAIDGHKVYKHLTELMPVGLLCTKQSPEERPSMRDVVGVLESIRATFLGTTTIGTTKFAADISSLLESRTTRGNNLGALDSRSCSTS